MIKSVAGSGDVYPKLDAQKSKVFLKLSPQQLECCVVVPLRNCLKRWQKVINDRRQRKLFKPFLKEEATESIFFV